MERSTSRRRFLALTAAGVGLSVAGCSGLSDDGTGDGGSGGDGSGQQATLVVQIDQQALQEAQTNASQQVQSGELNQSVAVQQYQETQQELLDDAISSAETEIQDTSLTIDDRKEQQGAFLVSGSSDEMVDLLSNDSIAALVPVSTFEELGQQQMPINQSAGG